MRSRQGKNVLVHCYRVIGLPFQQRNKRMPRLCAKAGVKPFGFHPVHHNAAAISFSVSGLIVQALMEHDRAATTDTYVQSAGLYADQSLIPSELGENDRVISDQADGNAPQDGPREAFCNQKTVINRLQ